MVAPEVQGSSVEAIEELAEDKRLKYAITKGISGPSLSRGIPSTAVFDVEGKLIYVGHPMSPDTEKVIKEALKEATPSEDEESSSGLAPRQQDLIANRTWTNSEGKEMTATLVSVTGNTGHFKFTNGQTFDLDLSKLSEADQAVIKEATKAVEGAAEDTEDE